MKQRRDTSLVYQYRYRSILVKMLVEIVLLVALLTGLFSLYSFWMEADHVQAQIEESQQNMLVNTARGLEMTFDNICQLMRQTLLNSYFISSMITPKNTDYDRTQLITGQLHGLAANNELIDTVLLYIPTDNMVYSSKVSFTKLLACPDADAVLKYYRQDLPFTTFAFEDFTAKLCADANRLYIYQPFFPEYLKQIGILVFVLDSRQLYNSIDSELSSGVAVYTAGGAPLLPTEDRGGLGGLLSATAAQSADRFGSFAYDDAELGQRSCYYYRSDLGWLYSYSTSASLFNSSALRLSRTPFLPLLLVLGLLLSIYLAFRLYRPIRQLTTLVAQVDPTGAAEARTATRDELELLNRVYLDKHQESEMLSRSLEIIKPAVLERLFSLLISGREPAMGRITDLLSGLNHLFGMDSQFIVIALAFVQADGSEPTETELSSHALELRRRLSEDQGPELAQCLIRPKDNTFAVLLVFSRQQEQSVCLEQTEARRNGLCRSIGALSCSALAESGNLYQHITDVRYSYLEAEEKLNHALFFRNGVEDEYDPADQTDTFFYARAKHLLLCISEGNQQRASQLAVSIAAEVAERCPSPQAALRQYLLMAEILIERESMLKLDSGDNLQNRKRSLQAQLAALSEVPEMQDCYCRFLLDLAQDIESKNKTKKYLHILRASEYVESNYSDRDLSLDQVAEHTGISPAYLSRLFKEEMGVSFVDYVRDIRLSNCKYLLATTEIPITDIGFQAGFNSMQSYYRVFKKQTGLSPGSYRQANRK